MDGITSTFLLHAVLTELGGRAEPYIPPRRLDNFGLSKAGIQKARHLGCSLIVTVDCGITAVTAVESANALGIDTVITDHHELPAVLPPAIAIVNPRRPGCGYPFKALAGVGVTFKLAQALLMGRGGLDRARDFLDVVALGTIADVVPLTGENRVLARLGLERLNVALRPGLRALMEVAKAEGRRVTSREVAFVLGPRINAAGRMGNAEQGLRLLMARDAAEASAVADSLEEDNRSRRVLDEKVLAEAVPLVQSELDWPNCAAIVLWSDEWHPGVIGIVASRLVERFQRPTILVTFFGEHDPGDPCDRLGRGSCRSLPGIDLNAVLGRCDDLLESWGGHALAAGFSVRRDRLPEFRARIDSLVREHAPPGAFTPRIVVDAEVVLRDCVLETVDWLDRLSPHGLDNPEPVFQASGLVVDSAGTVGGGKHLRAVFRDGTGRAEAVGFGLGALAPELARGTKCEAAFVPTRNEWQGETRVQLKLKGVRVA